MADPRTMVRSMLAAVGRRDVDALLACFSPDATWQNVPHPPAEGREGIRSVLAPILARSSAARWDTVTESYHENRAWLERVDRFWIDGNEYAVRCNGVLEFDPDTGLIAELRDYVDLGEWRDRLSAVNF